MERIKELGYLSIILIFAGIVLFWNIGTGSLTSWDEAIYAQVAKEMMHSNNWLDLTWAGQQWSDKPPFYMWVTVVFYKFFGINEFSARLFSVLCGIALVFTTYYLARRIYSKEIAFISSLVLLTTYQFILSAKMGMLDCAFTFFITLALFLFKTGEEKRGYLFWFWLAFTAAFMTKGTGAIIIPVIVTVYLFVSKQLSLVKEKQFLWGAFLSFLILLFWHGIAFMHYREGFVQGYFIKHLLMRTTTSVEGHYGDLFTYFGVLGNKGRPWGAIGIIAFIAAVYMIILKKDKKHILPVIWVAVVFLIFSLVKTKLYWYILPIYPALAILIASGISKLFHKKAAVLTLVLAVIFSAYLITVKKIFSLDYSPRTKSIALAVNRLIPSGEKFFLCAVGDPGIRFYLNDYKFISEYELKDAVGEKNSYIAFQPDLLKKLDKVNFDTLFSDSEIILVRIK